MVRRMQTQKVKTKSELSHLIWKRVEKILKDRHISQVQLRDMCIQQGYKITQPEISKLFTGKTPLTLYQLVAFSAALNVSIEYLIDNKSIYRRFHTEGDAFIKNPFDEAFNGYLGFFYTIFCSTSHFDDNKIIRGRLHFSPSEDQTICEAIYEIDTGEIDKRMQPIVKIYRGQLIISKMGVAYCILANDKIGEISMIEFRHRSFLVKQVECRMGLALTTTAGNKREPVVHRMLLSRHAIPDDQLHKMIPYLKLMQEDFLIKRDSLNIFAENKADSIDLEKLQVSSNVEEYMHIDTRIIPVINKKLNRIQIAEILGIFKSISTDGYCNVLQEEDDDAVFNLVRYISDDGGS